MHPPSICRHHCHCRCHRRRQRARVVATAATTFDDDIDDHDDRKRQANSYTGRERQRATSRGNDGDIGRCTSTTAMLILAWSALLSSSLMMAAAAPSAVSISFDSYLLSLLSPPTSSSPLPPRSSLAFLALPTAGVKRRHRHHHRLQQQQQKQHRRRGDGEIPRALEDLLSPCTYSSRHGAGKKARRNGDEDKDADRSDDDHVVKNNAFYGGRFVSLIDTTTLTWADDRTSSDLFSFSPLSSSSSSSAKSYTAPLSITEENRIVSRIKKCYSALDVEKVLIDALVFEGAVASPFADPSDAPFDRRHDRIQKLDCCLIRPCVVVDDDGQFSIDQYDDDDDDSLMKMKSSPCDGMPKKIVSSALRKMVELHEKKMMKKKTRGTGTGTGMHYDSIEESKEDAVARAELDVTRRLVPVLLESIGKAVLMGSKAATAAVDNAPSNYSSFSPLPPSALSVYTLQETLYSLAKLEQITSDNRRRRGGRKSSNPPRYDGAATATAAAAARRKGDLRPLARRVAGLIVPDDATRRIGPRRLVEMLWSMAVLDMKTGTATEMAEVTVAMAPDHFQFGGNIHSPHYPPTVTMALLADSICNRLAKSDVLGRLSGRDMSLGLWALAVLNRPHVGMIKSFARRLRKECVRERMAPSDIVRALWAVGRSVERLDDLAAATTAMSSIAAEGRKNNPAARGNEGEEDDKNNVIDIDLQSAVLRNEAETMCHTLTRELANPFKNVSRRKLDEMSAGQVADVLSSCVAFEMDNNTAVLGDISDRLQDERLLNGATCGDIARILLSFQRLYLVEEGETVTALGRKFLKLVQDPGTATCCTPRQLKTILRSVAMLPCGGDQGCYFNAAEILLLGDDKTELGMAPGEYFRYVEGRTFETSFLSKCNDVEVSNYIWSYAKARIFSKRLLVALADRMMEKDVAEMCSPSSASRVLWSYATLLSHEEGIDESGDLSTFRRDADRRLSGQDGSIDAGMRAKQFELFESLGGVLLSSRLTPVDASAAMWAMAKASYPVDMGIFDHLAEILACDFTLERAAVRHVAQALWSCGRMVSWEDPLRQRMGVVNSPPPYLVHARKFATFLLSLRDRLTAKDVAQSIWALGRLDIADSGTVSGFVALAIEKAPDCNSREVSNILWGLSKIGADDRDVVGALTTRLVSPAVLCRCSSQDAASAMYALGKMKVRDREVFAVLTSVIMQKLNDASARTIANTLWAHEAVNIVPPRAMLNLWANQYLRIVGLHHNVTNAKDLSLSFE